MAGLSGDLKSGPTVQPATAAMAVNTRALAPRRRVVRVTSNAVLIFRRPSYSRLRRFVPTRRAESRGSVTSRGREWQQPVLRQAYPRRPLAAHWRDRRSWLGRTTPAYAARSADPPSI